MKCIFLYRIISIFGKGFIISISIMESYLNNLDMDLENINWDELTDQEILSIISKFKTSWPTIKLSKSTRIERAVGSLVGEDINSVSRLSYCPIRCMNEYQKRNYQRCNTPGQEMFYGSLMPSDTDKIKLARITSLCESSKLFREQTNGTERFIFGKWELQQELCCIIIVDDENNYNSKLLNDAQQYIKNQNIKLTGNQRFLSKQFYKNIVHNKEYRLSAIYANYIFNEGIDAIIYPSSQTKSDGICIAIRPQIIDTNKLLLTDALDTVGIMDGKYTLHNVGRFIVNQNGKLTYEKINHDN